MIKYSRSAIFDNHTFLVTTIAIITISLGCNAGPAQAQIEKRITDISNKIYDELIEIRRDLHRNPELSGQESRTADIVAERLRQLGLEVRTNIGGHGVVGILRGKKDGPVVAYRADMDALPQDIQEEVEFKSTRPGVSHACGHDVHTTVGLGIAQVLSSLKDDLPGTIVFIFQPAEETAEGAKRMIEEGVLDDPAPEAIFAIHVSPMEAGIIATNPGVGLPGEESYSITLKGKENLQGTAQTLANAISNSSTVHFPERPEDFDRLANALFEENSELSGFILALARVEEGPSSNEKIVKGFVKAAGPTQYDHMRELTRKAVSDCEKQGFTCEFKIEKVLPDMYCDKQLASWAIDPLKAVLDEQSVLVAKNSFPFFGEDFAYYIHRIPGVLFYLGASNAEKGIAAYAHSPAFAVDESAIRVGIMALSNVIMQYQLEHSEESGSKSH